MAVFCVFGVFVCICVWLFGRMCVCFLCFRVFLVAPVFAHLYVCSCVCPCVRALCACVFGSFCARVFVGLCVCAVVCVCVLVFLCTAHSVALMYLIVCGCFRVWVLFLPVRFHLYVYRCSCVFVRLCLCVCLFVLSCFVFRICACVPAFV